MREGGCESLCRGRRKGREKGVWSRQQSKDRHRTGNHDLQEHPPLYQLPAQSTLDVSHSVRGWETGGIYDRGKETMSVEARVVKK
ncbi:hypothetical protein M404DRAFT_1001577 [Pisolithus tinctorius Marx 270]|uniref:Uncharacterized protein n=1 Tax=Pisolithus tinctorius Marx 270 TaxID=870435 RepID=A0A0C3K132_PISTI|nr:hypothetical protein M404DRAFT_1001577 [Pisolithus tinctorius Marx 270]